MKVVLELAGEDDIPCLIDPDGTIQGFMDRWRFAERLFPGRVDSNGAPLSFNHKYQTQVPVDVAPYTTMPEPKLNMLYIPIGAQRHTMCVVALAAEDATPLLNVMDDQQSSHRVTLWLNDSPTDDLLEDAARLDVKVELIALSAVKIPSYVDPSGDGQTVYLVSLVDERYFLASCEWKDSGAAGTWAQVFAKCGLNDDDCSTVHADYQFPNYYLFSRHVPLMLAADAVVESVGMRVIPRLYDAGNSGNPLIAISPSDGLTIFNANYSRSELIAGEVHEPLPWANNIVLYCPKRHKLIPASNLTPGGTDAIAAFTEDYAGADLKVVHDHTTFAYSARTPVMSTFYKESGATDNTTDCEDLAAKVAADYWAWQAKAFEFSMPGIVKWDPSGYEDFILYDWRCFGAHEATHDIDPEAETMPATVCTHVRSMPHRAPRVQLSQVAYEAEYTPAKLITAILMTDLTTSDSAVFGWITSYFDGDLMSWNAVPQMVVLKNLFIGAGTYMFSGSTGDACIARWRRYGDDDIEYQIINKPCAAAAVLEQGADPDPEPDPTPEQPPQ